MQTEGEREAERVDPAVAFVRVVASYVKGFIQSNTSITCGVI